MRIKGPTNDQKNGIWLNQKGLITSYTLQGDNNYFYPPRQKKQNEIIGRHLIKGYGSDVMVKDKTIKNPFIQPRYTRSNWCVDLWRAEKQSLCEGWKGFGK